MKSPEITFLVPSPDGYARLDDSIARAPMRLTRRGETGEGDLSLSYGQYFKAIHDVLTQDSLEGLIQATAEQLGSDISGADIREIRICAEKHGSDYHPAKIEVVADRVSAVFVMNVAVSPRGKARAYGEFQVLQHLNNKYAYPFLPRTYLQGQTAFRTGLDPSEDDAVVMFLADWFQGYHEFHLSFDKHGGSQQLALWDVEKGTLVLSPVQARQVYREASRTLTLYYDVETFEQIFPWHHAAGDFVVRLTPESVDVKLITARQYAGMLEPDEGVSVHDALLFFLLNLSLRMRLDRLDGVGPIAWADEGCIDATLEGFVQALAMKEREGAAKAGFVDAFFRYCADLGEEDLSSMLYALADACDPSAPDMPVIRRHLAGHLLTFRSALQNLRAL
jgi:hypothetical protein